MLSKLPRWSQWVKYIFARQKCFSPAPAPIYPKGPIRPKPMLKLAAHCEISACAGMTVGFGDYAGKAGMSSLAAFYLDFVARFFGFVVDHFRWEPGSENLDLRLFLEPFDDVG